MASRAIYPFLLGLLLVPVAAAERTATTSAIAKASVATSIAITRVKDLDFGEGYTGDGPLQLLEKDGARFAVTGQAGKTFHIVLPALVQLRTLMGLLPNQRIDVTQFKSQPVSPASLGTLGSSTLYVGATRAALPLTQQPGAYEASFLVTVTYE